jgi:hypothetical protein
MNAQIFKDAVILITDEEVYCLPIVSLAQLAEDTLNWFDEAGNLWIGSLTNPDHLKQWEQWRKSLASPQGNGGPNDLP